MAMNNTKIGKRLVVIAGSAPVNKAVSVREPVAPLPKARRIVVIRDGQSVGRRRPLRVQCRPIKGSNHDQA